MQEFYELEEILSTFLGESKNGLSNGQIQYCCPQCAQDEGVESDGKFNLEVNILRGGGIFRCWKCDTTNGMSGKLSKLIKLYAGKETLQEYRSAIDTIKKSKEYELIFEDEGISFEDDEEFKVTLPEKTHDFLFDGNKREERALNYLLERGIIRPFIEKYRLKYTDYYCNNKNFRNRIIIPSYDKYNQLNYFTGRDYTDRNFRKYFNFENSNRKEIVFNEHLINWDGDIVLVEGPTDHIVVPNSVPLLGKSIKSDYYLFECLTKKSTEKIIVFLDGDAMKDADNICNTLASFELCDRLYIVPTNKLLIQLNNKFNFELKKLDPSKIFEKLGHKGIAWALKQAEKYVCI